MFKSPLNLRSTKYDLSALELELANELAAHHEKKHLATKNFFENLEKINPRPVSAVSRYGVAKRQCVIIKNVKKATQPAASTKQTLSIPKPQQPKSSNKASKLPPRPTSAATSYSTAQIRPMSTQKVEKAKIELKPVAFGASTPRSRNKKFLTKATSLSAMKSMKKVPIELTLTT